MTKPLAAAQVATLVLHSMLMSSPARTLAAPASRAGAATGRTARAIDRHLEAKRRTRSIRGAGTRARGRAAVRVEAAPRDGRVGVRDGSRRWGRSGWAA